MNLIKVLDCCRWNDRIFNIKVLIFYWKYYWLKNWINSLSFSKSKVKIFIINLNDW